MIRRGSYVGQTVGVALVMCLAGYAADSRTGSSTSATQPAGPELVVPVQVAHETAPDILGPIDSTRSALLTCRITGQAVHQFLVRHGTMPGGPHGDGVADPARLSRVEIHLAPDASGPRLPLDDVMGTTGGWRFVGVPAHAKTLISTTTGAALIVPDSPLQPAGQAVRFKKNIDWLASPGSRALVIIRPANRHLAVILLDRFGRMWFDDRRVTGSDELHRLLAGNLSRDPKLQPLILHDPVALTADVEHLVNLCLAVGIPSDRIHTRRATRAMGLDSLTIPAHDPAVQRWAITTQFSGKMGPWRQLAAHHREWIDQVRQGVRDYRNQFDKVRGQINRWHRDYLTVAGQGAKAKAPAAKTDNRQDSKREP